MRGDSVKGVIYQYNSPNGKIYVGQTLYLQRKRINKHKHEAITRQCDTPFGRAIRKYGWDTIRETYKVIEYVEAPDKQSLKKKLTERENYYILELNTLTPNGYNVQLTNQEKLGEYRNKALMYEKISNSLKGKYLNEKNPNSRRVINIDTNIIYPSISQASRETGVSVQVICSVLKGKQLKAGGFSWCYIDDEGNIDKSNLRSINRKQLPVYCVELDKEFVSAYAGAKYIGKPNGKANIRRVCEANKQECKHKSYGYTWVYINKQDDTVPSQQGTQ